MNRVQGGYRLLNHSRFPTGRAHGFAAPLRVALGLRPKCPQGTRFPARLPGFGAAPQALCRSTKKRALRVPEGHKKRASLNPSPNISANGAAILHPEGPRRFYSENIIIGKTRVSRVPSVARNARRALPPEALASSCVFLHQAAFLASLRSLATLDGLCRRKRWRPPASSCIKPRFSRPFGRSQRSTGFAAGSAGVLPRLPASSRVSCSLRSLATLTAFAAAEVFGALPQTPARA